LITLDRVAKKAIIMVYLQSNQSTSLHSLVDELLSCSQSHFSGRLELEGNKGQTWNFYYRLGRIIWATGGSHPVRRWRRKMIQYCPQVDINKIHWESVDTTMEYWDYKLLTNLYKKEEIESKQLDSIAQSIIAELLFDIAQIINFIHINFIRNSQLVLDLPINFRSANIFIKRMEDEWSSWSSYNLGSFFPNLSPKLEKEEEFRKLVNPNIYEQFVKLISGEHTLRDLTLIMKRDLREVTCLLQPYILRSFVKLVEVSDYSLPQSHLPKNQVSNNFKKNTAPLIACVDDSPQVCEMLEKIITSNGMRFIKIQDAIQALPKLLEQKPDFIFLDLIMPVVNGYEICSQIRRASYFTNIPVVILTGSDGLLDKVRAKMVGSTDFMAKPIETEKIISIIQKHLKNNSSNKNPPQSQNMNLHNNINTLENKEKSNNRLELTVNNISY
jgi:two-component system, chemotaxis family, response regulator PixG